MKCTDWLVNSASQKINNLKYFIPAAPNLGLSKKGREDQF